MPPFASGNKHTTSSDDCDNRKRRRDDSDDKKRESRCVLGKKKWERREKKEREQFPEYLGPSWLPLQDEKNVEIDSDVEKPPDEACDKCLEAGVPRVKLAAGNVCNQCAQKKICCTLAGPRKWRNICEEQRAEYRGDRKGRSTGNGQKAACSQDFCFSTSCTHARRFAGESSVGAPVVTGVAKEIGPRTHQIEMRERLVDLDGWLNQLEDGRCEDWNHIRAIFEILGLVLRENKPAALGAALAVLRTVYTPTVSPLSFWPAVDSESEEEKVEGMEEITEKVPRMLVVMDWAVDFVMTGDEKLPDNNETSGTPETGKEEEDPDVETLTMWLLMKCEMNIALVQTPKPHQNVAASGWTVSHS
ncbi:hypothetical protein B0H19DRAFT_1267389 [Mycena capillaripes]|nr:hypothetical protein B0H19DRAFT_1267389 [Mycena capillaripes]